MQCSVIILLELHSIWSKHLKFRFHITFCQIWFQTRIMKDGLEGQKKENFPFLVATKWIYCFYITFPIENARYKPSWFWELVQFWLCTKQQRLPPCNFFCKNMRPFNIKRGTVSSVRCHIFLSRLRMKINNSFHSLSVSPNCHQYQMSDTILKS